MPSATPAPPRNFRAPTADSMDGEKRLLLFANDCVGSDALRTTPRRSQVALSPVPPGMFIGGR